MQDGHLKCPDCGDYENIKTYADYDDLGNVVSDGFYCYKCGYEFHNG